MKFFKYCYFAAVFAFAGLLSYLQLSLLPAARNCILNREGVAALSSASAIADGLKGCGSLTLAAVAAAIAILSAIILFFGFFRGHFARAYSYLEKRNREWVIVAVVVAAAALPYLARGNVVLGDAMQFSALSIYLKESLMSLSYPFWTFYWYLGSAPLAFYGWLYLLAAGAANSFLSIDAANKILFFLLHLGSALAAYAFVKTTTKNGKMAVIAALVYGLSFEHIARIMVGRSITSLTYFLTPLLFLAYELRLDGKIGGFKATALIAVVASMLIANHQADAVFIIAIFALYAAIRALEKETGEEAKKLALELIAAMALAFLIISFWAVPMLAEQGQASATGKALEILQLKAPEFGMIKDMVLWPGKWGEKPMYYLGLTSLALAAAGLFYLIRKRKIAIAAAATAAIFMLLLQSPRYAPVMLLMLGASAGYGFLYLAGKVKIESRMLLLIVSAILIADMVPATVQLGYPDFSYNKQFYDTIKANGGERVLDLSTDRRTFWPSYIYINNHAETVFGTLVESAPRSLPYAAAISQKAAQEFYDRQTGFSEETLQGLYLLGVKYVVLHNEQRGKNPEEVFAGKRGALGIERGLEAIELNHSVIIASGKKARIDYEPALEKEEGWDMRTEFEKRGIDTSETERIIDAMQIDLEKGTAAKILVKEGGSETIASNGELEADVSSVKTSAGRIEISYTAGSDAFLQLSYSHSPYLSVKIDGKEAEYWKTAINTIAVKTTRGEHTITIQARQSRLRKILMPVSLAGLALAVYLMTKKNRKI